MNGARITWKMFYTYIKHVRCNLKNIKKFVFYISPTIQFYESNVVE